MSEEILTNEFAEMQNEINATIPAEVVEPVEMDNVEVPVPAQTAPAQTAPTQPTVDLSIVPENIPEDSHPDFIGLIVRAVTQKFAGKPYSRDDLTAPFFNDTGKCIDEKAVQKIIDNHTIKIDFDFSGITLAEITDQLTSTTTFLKMYQNNVLSGLSDVSIVKLAQDVQTVSIRAMLDNRSKKEVNPEKAKENFLKAQEKSGRTAAETIAELQAMIAALESSGQPSSQNG